jgi:peptidoglycan/xylan/chitin deacetylase (PgdA/CDA1 family)
MYLRRSKHDKIIEWITKILSFYGRCKPEYIIEGFSEETLISLARQLCQPSISQREEVVRKYGDFILRSVSYQQRQKISSLMKRFRNRYDRFYIHYPKDLRPNQLLSELMDESVFTWNGHRSAVCLTYDVDNQSGYRYLPQLMSINRQHDLTGTINFLTHQDYEINPALVSQFLEAGYEIGLHGRNHDIGLAYRSHRTIQRSLTSALERIKTPVLGFRGPALCSSPTLFSILDTLGIRYDSSLQVLSPFYHSVGLNFPFPLFEHNLWEFPVAIQDDYFFRDFQLSDEEALSVIKRIIMEIHDLGGVAILVFHPHIMVDRSFFYEVFLNTLNSLDGLWMTQSSQLLDYVSVLYREHLESLQGNA